MRREQGPERQTPLIVRDRSYGLRLALLLTLAACADPLPDVSPTDMASAEPPTGDALAQEAGVDHGLDFAMDARVRTDQGQAVPLDSSVPPDATSMDVDRMDAAIAPRDATADAHPAIDADLDARADASANDGAVLPRDATPDQRLNVDMLVDAAGDLAEVDFGLPRGCEGIVPPVGPAMPEGVEACNYVDDDGDGLIDEGFSYAYTGRRTTLTSRPLDYGTSAHRFAAGPRGYIAAWLTGEPEFVILDAGGCPLTRLLRLYMNPDWIASASSLEVAAAGDRYAVVFTELRPNDGMHRGFGTFIQIFDSTGEPVGVPLDIDPALSHAGKNAVVGLGADGFAVFSTAYHPESQRQTYSSFSVVDLDGNLSVGPSHPYDQEEPGGLLIHRITGMAFDGSDFALAWTGPRVGAMTRWTRDGDVLLPPVIPHGIGNGAGRSGLVWNGRNYVIARRGPTLRLVFLLPNGEAEPWSPVEVAQGGVFGDAFAYRLRQAGQGLTMAGYFHPVGGLLRFDQSGTQIAPAQEPAWNERLAEDIDIPEGRPIASFLSEVVDDGRALQLQFDMAACIPN